MIERNNIAESLDVMRFPLMLGVILIHSEGLFPENQYLVNYSCSMCWLFTFIKSYLLPIFVPSFFFISGFLFFLHVPSYSIGCYKKKMIRRYHSLFVPYILWTVIDFLYLAVKGFVSQGATLQDTTFLTQMLTLNIFWDYTPQGLPLHQPLWYVRNLLVVAFCSPIIYQFLKRFYAALLVLVALGIIYVSKPFMPIYNSIALSFFYFSLGAFFVLHHDRLKAHLNAINVVMILIAILVCYLCHVGKLSISCFTIPAVACAILSFVHIQECLRVRLHPIIIRASFFTYCLHTFIIVGLVEMGFRYIIPDNAASIFVLFRYLLAPVMVFFICCLIYAMMQKIIPSALDILTGGRTISRVEQRNNKNTEV